MPHMFTNRHRIHDLTKDRTDLHAQFRWETINAVIYKIGGVVFIIGSILFFPRFEAYEDLGALTFFAGSLLYLVVTVHDLLEVHQHWRNSVSHDRLMVMEYIAASSYVWGTILFTGGSIFFPLGGGMVRGRRVVLHCRQPSFRAGSLHQRAADHTGRKPCRHATYEPDRGDLRGGLGAFHGGFGALPLGGQKPIHPDHIVYLPGLAVSHRQHPVFCRRSVQLLAGLSCGS